MKKLFLILFIFGGIVFAQQYEDVIYLKNGSIIRGVIIEQAPNRYIKIKSGQNVFVYQIYEIEKMVKEIISSDISNKTWSIQAGLGSHRSFSLIAISKDIRLGNNGAIFLTAGLGSALIGAGFSKQSNYNNNGINFSSTLGLNALGPSLNGNLSYQWRVGNQGFITAGLMAGMFYTEEYYYDYYRTTELPYILPTIAFDYRF